MLIGYIIVLTGLHIGWFTCPVSKPASMQIGLNNIVDSLISKSECSQNTGIKTSDLASQFAYYCYQQISRFPIC